MSNGSVLSQQRYLPFGAVRTDVGTVTQTDFGYTFQRNNSYIKLYDYRSRWYDPQLGQFINPILLYQMLRIHRPLIGIRMYSIDQST